MLLIFLSTVCRACYGVLRFVMENGAKGCEVCNYIVMVFLVLSNVTVTSVDNFLHFQVIVSGKLRAQRAKSMKFKDGYMVSSGQPVKEYIDSAVRHVLLRQVSFMLSIFFLSMQMVNSNSAIVGTWDFLFF